MTRTKYVLKLFLNDFKMEDDTIFYTTILTVLILYIVHSTNSVNYCCQETCITVNYKSTRLLLIYTCILKLWMEVRHNLKGYLICNDSHLGHRAFLTSDKMSWGMGGTMFDKHV